eukprot:scpid101135/ scgid22665/ 
MTAPVAIVKSEETVLNLTLPSLDYQRLQACSVIVHCACLPAVLSVIPSCQQLALPVLSIQAPLSLSLPTLAYSSTWTGIVRRGCLLDSQTRATLLETYLAAATSQFTAPLDMSDAAYRLV